jgi:hypothetical protein
MKAATACGIQPDEKQRKRYGLNNHPVKLLLLTVS